MPEDEPEEQFEGHTEDEPEDLPDILERINANLKAIHSELEMQNKGAMRSNARLAVLIVVFAIPASFLVEVLSWTYVNEILPYALDPATVADANGRELVIGISSLATLTAIFIMFFYIIYKYFTPLVTLLDDPELEEFIKEIKDETKSKK
jgi:hypothetical protein